MQRDAAGWISTRPWRRSDHAFDAVVAALTARAAATGRVTRPGPEDLEVARAEGWIALPTAPIADLVG